MFRGGLVVCMVLATSSRAGIFYIDPAGSDVLAGTTPATAWKSWSFALPRLNPGDTLMVGGGTWQADAGPAIIDCAAGARSGTADAGITVRAINERAPHIITNGAQPALGVFNCSN